MDVLKNDLNILVADFNVMFVKLHHHHWFVTGVQFYTLHERFEKLYEEMNDLYDTIAERLITIGGIPASSLKDYLALTTLKEATGILKPLEMVQSIIDDVNHLIQRLKKTLIEAQSVEDDVTADMMIGALASFEKHIWMLTALLK
jgi:starvation-inducible DNA-binding protein